jgi:hypothetical protein
VDTTISVVATTKSISNYIEKNIVSKKREKIEKRHTKAQVIPWVVVGGWLVKHVVVVGVAVVATHGLYVINI